jgi:hypothetical protein
MMFPGCTVKTSTRGKLNDDGVLCGRLPVEGGGVLTGGGLDWLLFAGVGVCGAGGTIVTHAVANTVLNMIVKSAFFIVYLP